MFQQKPGRLRRGQISDARTIASIASPARQDLLDTLEALGGVATIAELAAQLGRPADGLYYHVDQLQRAGLLVPAPEGTSRAGRSERRYATVSHPRRALNLVYDPTSDANVTALRDVVGGMLRITRRDFDRALIGAHSGAQIALEGPRRELWAARGSGWLSDGELAEINRLLTRVTQLLRKPKTRTRQRLVSVCFVIAPVPSQPVRREAAAPAKARRAKPATKPATKPETTRSANPRRKSTNT